RTALSLSPCLPPTSPLLPYPTLFRSCLDAVASAWCELLQGGDQLAEMVDHGLGPERARRSVVVAEAEEHARGSCRLCGAGVEGGDANHCKSAFSAAQRNRMMDHVGCGLGAPGPPCVAAADTCDEAPDSQFGKQIPRKKLRLVGNDRKLATLAGERIQCIEASGIEHRMLRNMRLVIFEQRGIEVGEPVFFHHPASDCERSLEHQPRAAP